ncbi:MAG: SDR family NAD(P)-dependent oxidoreductase, partial [Nostocales cyanobacterium W4_Combined_metabat2_030]|nr:SDR family NAD(P)-dependent oxidoreductase [Nostocales cyanobacterium W4_Combined_metabat2_030]
MQVCLVTGGNSGVGLMTSLGLAQLGHHVFIACRSQTKAAKAISYIRQTTNNPNIEFLPLNLASLDSVRHCVKLFLEKKLPLHILVNNAGIFDGQGVTKEGFELIWGTNYLGHFLLTYLLLDKLQESAPSRIVMVSSDLALKPATLKWDLFVKPTRLNFIESYNQSKLCLLLLTRYLSQNLTKVTVNAVHPGFVQSNITIGHRLSKYLGLGISPQKGAYSSLLCATSPEFELITGKFLDKKGQEITLPLLAQNNDLCQELWQKSLVWTGAGGSVEKDRINYDGTDEIWGPYSLKLNQDEMAVICEHLFKKVLFKPPVKVLLIQGLKALVRLQFGSLMLLLVQCYKRQFYMERHLDSPVLLQLCKDENLLQVLRDYLGESFKLWRSELWVNYPSHQLIPFWHQDIYPNLLAGEGKTISVYIGLTEVNKGNGFEYIPEGEVKNCQVQITDPFSGNHFFYVPKKVIEKAIPVVLQPGEFVVFTDKLVHRSIYNTSGKVRLSLTLRVAQGTVEVLPGYTPN